MASRTGRVRTSLVAESAPARLPGKAASCVRICAACLPPCRPPGKEPVQHRRRATDRDEEVTVDYRLLPRFEASRRRHEDARTALPERWRSDPRLEAQLINEIYVALVARARAHIEEISTPELLGRTDANPIPPRRIDRVTSARRTL